MVDYIKSPKTGRWIIIGGPAYTKLLKSKIYSEVLHKKTPLKKRRRKPSYTYSGCACSK